MVGFDFSPFYRTTVGFDRMARALESAGGQRNADDGFPPYDIETVGEDHYRLTFAVAGPWKTNPSPLGRQVPFPGSSWKRNFNYGMNIV